MAYNVYFSCDSCGATYNWINHAVSYSAAVSIARRYGWSVGKRGWFCPERRKKRRV
jgi:hypothetical protein|nr:MAG TPA: adenylate kinase [Caudoviricetes sp.]